MVCNNNIHSPRRFRHFFYSADAAVYRNDQRNAFLIQILQCFIIQAVSFALPFGNIGRDIRL